METTPTSFRSSLLTYSICLFFTLNVSKGHSEFKTQANVSRIPDYSSDLKRNFLLLPIFPLPQASSSMFAHANSLFLGGFSLITNSPILSGYTINGTSLKEIRGLISGFYTEFTYNQGWRFAKKGNPMPDGHSWPFDESTSIQELTQSKSNDLDFTGVKIGDDNNPVYTNYQIIMREEFPPTTEMILN